MILLRFFRHAMAMCEISLTMIIMIARLLVLEYLSEKVCHDTLVKLAKPPVLDLIWLGETR